MIDLPGGVFVANPDGSASLVFYSAFNVKWEGIFKGAQEVVDSETLRLCEPYIPLLQGVLIRSGLAATVIGSGKVSWITPYARRRYFDPRDPGTATGPLRGPFWFHRMKAVEGSKIIEGARQYVRSKS